MKSKRKTIQIQWKSMSKSYIKMKFLLFLAKRNHVQDDHQMTEAFGWETELFKNRIQIIILTLIIHKTKTISNFHTYIAMKWLDYANLELTTVVADSTFLKRMEPVVFFFLLVAWAGFFDWLTLQFDLPAIEFSIGVWEHQCSIVPTMNRIGHMMTVWV